MSFITVVSVVTGQTYSAANYNTYVKDNINSLWVYTTAGDIVYALNSTTLSRLAIGATGQYLGVTAGVPAWKNDGVPGVFTAAGDLVYGSALDTSAILNKPTASVAVLQETSSGVPSWRSITQVFELQVVAEASNVELTSLGYFYVPVSMNGMNLVRAIAMVLTAGVTNPTTVQVRNMTKYPSNDSLSVAISIASGGTVATVGTIDTARDDVSTNDLIKVYVTGVSTTKPKGLWVVLEYQLP